MTYDEFAPRFRHTAGCRIREYHQRIANQTKRYKMPNIDENLSATPAGVTSCDECRNNFRIDVLCLRCRRLFCQHAYTADHICEKFNYINKP